VALLWNYYKKALITCIQKEARRGMLQIEVVSISPQNGIAARDTAALTTDFGQLGHRRCSENSPKTHHEFRKLRAGMAP
jgi:hypothetical protein